MDDRLIDLLRRAEDLKKELDSLRPLDKEREAIVMQKLRLDWNYHSNHLEGNSLTFGETKALILFGITAQGKPLQDHIEITGHDEAIKWIEDVIHKKEPLTENFIRQLHTLLLKEPYEVDAITPDGQPTKKLIKVGQYKTTPNHVKTKTGEIFRFATPEETPSQMHDLMEWYRKKSGEKDVNPIILAAEFHYKFIRIHPFDDGNGRMARILMNFILMQYGYPPVIVKTGEKEKYIAALQQADAGIFEPFFEFIINNEIRSLDIMLAGARGENVEEPDDLDKELALLEQRFKILSSERKFRSPEKNFEDKILYLIRRSLIPLYTEVFRTLKSFNKFYESFMINAVGGISISGINKIKRNEDFHFYGCVYNMESIEPIDFSEDLSKYSQQILPQKLNVIELMTLLNGFKIVHVSGDRYEKSIFFYLKESTFVVELNDVSIEKKFEYPLTNSEIDILSKALKTDVANYLKSLE